MKDLKIRWRLHRDEAEPTTRQRGLFIIRGLQKLGYDVGVWEGESGVDIIVLQYNLADLDDALKSSGVVVQDINDMVFAEDHPYRNEVIAGMKRVHAVVAGTERLGQHLRRLHPFVRVIEEPVDERYFGVKPQKHDGLNMIFMGMNDNIVYFNEIDDALERLYQEHQFTVDFVIPSMDGFRKPNEAKVKTKPYPTRFIPWTMEALLAQMSLADVAVVPLFNNAWTMCKASNKSLSFMAAGIPVVASDVIPYQGIIQHGKNGFLCRHPEGWLEALDSLLTDSRLRGRIGTAGKLTANQYRVDEIVGDWLGLFEEIRPR